MAVVENKIPYVSSLVNKTHYNAKISDIESKYITKADYNKFTKDIVDNSIKSKILVTKTDFDAKLKNLYKKINSNKTKHLLVESELNKLQLFDSSYFTDKNYFGDNGTKLFIISKNEQIF